jgi:hypothetical protein
VSEDGTGIVYQGRLMKSQPAARHTGRTDTPGRLVRLAVPAAMFVGLTLLRTDDISRSFWMFDDQIR